MDAYVLINLRQVALENAIKLAGDFSRDTPGIVKQAQAFYDFMKGSDDAMTPTDFGATPD